MGRSLFLLLISSIIGLITGASFLSATDTILPKAPGMDAVLTVLPQPVIEEPISNEVSNVAPLNIESPVFIKNYNVTIVTDEIVGSGLSYADIYRTGKFIYAHNSSALFGGLPSLQIGEIFTISESGIVRSYRVMDKVIYEKGPNGYLNSSLKLTKAVEYEANGYDISMMTCFGTSYGNGDASHRLVIFANAI